MYVLTTLKNICSFHILLCCVRSAIKMTTHLLREDELLGKCQITFQWEISNERQCNRHFTHWFTGLIIHFTYVSSLKHRVLISITSW